MGAINSKQESRGVAEARESATLPPYAAASGEVRYAAPELAQQVARPQKLDRQDRQPKRNNQQRRTRKNKEREAQQQQTAPDPRYHEFARRTVAQGNGFFDHDLIPAGLWPSESIL